MEQGGAPSERGHGSGCRRHSGRVGGRAETWIIFSLESHKGLGMKHAGLFPARGYCLSRGRTGQDSASGLSRLCTPGPVFNPG